MIMRESETEQEKNALTIMPLPVRIPALWYDILPRVLPLVTRASEKTEFCMPEETTQIFLQRWKKALIRREGNFVWLHLGGVACYEIIPNFVKSVRDKIIYRDKEIKEKLGVKAVIQHWRTSIKELQHLNDEAILRVRNATLRILQPDTWHEGLGRAWSYAAERANINFCNIRPVIQRWIEKNEEQYELNKPFGGRFTESAVPVMQRTFHGTFPVNNEAAVIQET
jgi:hypothetical protein